MDEREVLAIVLEVATNAVFAVGIAHLNLKVIAALRGKPPRDFLVAIQAFESGSAGAKLMAARALGGAGKGLVGFGKGPWRNLSLQ